MNPRNFESVYVTDLLHVNAPLQMFKWLLTWFADVRA